MLSCPSHIFCLPCSEHHGLLAPASDRRVCPACHTILINHDDAASTNLNPPEDYKTSVLSGLSPTTIMECAGRGLAFWAYQSTQEMYIYQNALCGKLMRHRIYQEFLARSLTDKCQWLNGDMERIVHEANSEIDSLSQKLSRMISALASCCGTCDSLTAEMEVEHEKMKADKANLAAALREKARKHQQTHELYERLRRKEMAAATQSAAFDTADDVLQYGHNRPHDSHLDLESAVPYNNHGRAGSDGSGGPGGASRPPARGTPAVRGPSLHTRKLCPARYCPSC